MFAVDDNLEKSAKHEALDVLPSARRARAFEAWVRLGAACRARGNGGLVTLALLAKILHAWRAAERLETMADLVEAKGGRPTGLVVVVPDGWKFHGWEEWQPTEEESAAERLGRSKKSARQRKWRLRKALGVDGEPSTVDGHVDVYKASTVDVSRDASGSSTRDDVDVSRATRDAGARAPDPIPTLPIVPSERESGETLFGENLEKLWRAWAKSYSSARGQIAGRTHDVDQRETCRVLIETAAATGRSFESLVAHVLEGYWRDPWPRQHANKATFRNLLEQLPRLIESGSAEDGDPVDYDPATHGEPRDPRNFAAWNAYLDRAGGVS